MWFSVILILVSIVAFRFYRHIIVDRYINDIPGPEPLPLIGNAHELGPTPIEYLACYMRWSKEFNYRMFRYWMGPYPYVVLTDPKEVEPILTSQSILKKSDVYNMLDPWLHEGLLTSQGQKWFKRRKLITPSFHFKILVDFLEVMNTSTDKLMQKLEEKAKNGAIFDIQSMVQNCTLDIICETAMGIKINVMDYPDSEIAVAFHDICFTMQSRIFSLMHRFDFVYKRSLEYQRQAKALKVLNTLTNNVIENRRKFYENNNDTTENNAKDENNLDMPRMKKAFIDNLITAKVDGVPLSNSDIAEEVSTFLFTGHDTTTSGISFAIYILSRHPDIQQKVFEEQVSIFGNDLKRPPTYQEIQDMKYLELVIKETERLYPSVPFIGRYTEEQITINETVIPANTGLVINIMGMGYNEKYFKDPYKVDPDRFLKEKREKAGPYEYTPFSAGPRNCIGQKFAMLELKSLVSKIVRNFTILPPVEGVKAAGYYEDCANKGPHYPVMSAVLTLKSENGIDVRLTARNSE